LVLYVSAPKDPNDQLPLLRSLAEMRKGTVVKDEPGTSDHAFSAVYSQHSANQIPSMGAQIEFVKNARLVFVTCTSDSPGTEQMRDALRGAAKEIAQAL
jgi:hypothetical protein